VLLALFAVVSVWVLGVNLWQVVVHGRAWTGVDGTFPFDQLQYQAWVRDASNHLFASDLFVIRGTAHDYLEPVLVLAGALTALGIAPWLALLLLTPIVVVVLFAAVAMWCRRLLRDRWARRVALAVALFFGFFGTPVDEWLPFLTWGYLPAALSVAALIGALIGYEHSLRTGERLWIAPLLGLLASWLHPWQGEELVLILVAVEAWCMLRPSGLSAVRSHWTLLLATLAATALPLLYYLLLDRLDPIWQMAQVAGALPRPLGPALLPLIPLIVLSLFTWWRAPDSWLGAAMRVWPLAALFVFELAEHGVGAAPLHALSGVTIPLAVLAVEGLERVPLARARWVMVPLAAAATIPASIHLMSDARTAVAPSAANNTFITHGEQRAIDYLAALRTPGGVLTTFDLGAVVPGATGRRTYVGNCYWSLPGCDQRQAATEQLFDQDRSAAQERAFVARTGARFVLEPCYSHVDLGRVLAPMVAASRRFGCAAVYELRS
jgi:hypothetical protein